MSVGGSVLGDGARDSVSARLTPGEFIVRKAMVNKYGEPMLRAINQGSFVPGYSMGAINQGNFSSPSYKVEHPFVNVTTQQKTSLSSINAPVYNTYDMNFSINGANASADEIANRVMAKIKRVDSARVRSINGY